MTRGRHPLQAEFAALSGEAGPDERIAAVGVLDDDAVDPGLDRVLDIYVDEIATLLKEQLPPLDVIAVMSLAHEYVGSLSEPGRQTRGTRPYGGYSSDMLTIAALCRLADRLPTVALPRPGQGPAIAT